MTRHVGKPADLDQTGPYERSRYHNTGGLKKCSDQMNFMQNSILMVEGNIKKYSICQQNIEYENKMSTALTFATVKKVLKQFITEITFFVFSFCI